MTKTAIEDLRERVEHLEYKGRRGSALHRVLDAIRECLNIITFTILFIVAVDQLGDLWDWLKGFF